MLTVMNWSEANADKSQFIGTHNGNIVSMVISCMFILC